jgi:integrase
MGPVGFEPTTSRLSAGCSSQPKLWAHVAGPIPTWGGSSWPQVVTRVPSLETPQSRKATLLQDAEIRGWIKDHRSPNTAKNQFEQLELFCRRTGLGPAEILQGASARPNKRFRESVLDWVASEREAGRPDQYVKSVWYAVRSWLRYNEVALEWSPELNVQAAATLENERVPTVDELRQLLAVLSPRDRAAALFLATSGVRIGVLADRFEAGGLTLDGLPDLVPSGGEPRFEVTPALVRVPAPLSKSGKGYYTFITAEAAEALLVYLQERVRRGETLTRTSPLIGPEPKASHSHFRKGRDGSLFISGKSLGHAIRLGLRKVTPKGVRVRPHTLRAFMSTQMELAERHGKITRSLREYFLGHSLQSVELRYNLAKKHSEKTLEELRRVYAGCEPFLTVASARSEPAGPAAISKMLLMGFGYSEEELASVDLADIGVVQELVAKKMGSCAEMEPKQKVVSPGELTRYLDEGWTVAVALGTGQVVLNPPKGPRLAHPAAPARFPGPRGHSFAQ